MHDGMAPRCILNGLQTVPVLEELSKLDCLGKQLVQRVKAFQMVVRLGTSCHCLTAHIIPKVYFVPVDCRS